MSVHVSPVRTYLLVFTALMVGTAITVAAAFVHLGPLNNVVAMGIAITKAALVVMFFMHVKYSSRMIALCVVSGVFWLTVLFVLTLSDYLTRGDFGVLGR